METTFMNRENSKMSEPHKFVPNLPQRLDLRSSDIYIYLLHVEKCKKTV